MSHQGLEAYAWDFAMPMGSLILAARGGRVSFVEQHWDIGGPNFKKYAAFANYVAIDQGDGTTALYLHLMQHGSLVKPGQPVIQGQPIAYSGETGFASGPHLHFQVERTDPFSYFTQSIPVGFAEVTTDLGVPQQGLLYTSHNARGPFSGLLLRTVAPAMEAVGVGGLPVPSHDARYVADITIPDGTPVFERQSLTKTWQVSDPGPLAWPVGTRLQLISRSSFGAWRTAPLAPATPGQTARVTVQIRAPDAPGSYSAVWRLTDPTGQTFGDDLSMRVRVTGPLPTAPVPKPASGRFTYFPQTGHTISGAFARTFWSHGGIEVFGYPRTEPMQEDGMTVQYFQRARFELHPDQAGTPYEVQLSLLGDDATVSRRPFPTVAPFPTSTYARYFPQTGHSVSYAFLRFFDTHGGLDNFGYPISQEMTIQRPTGPRTVQYFQRARFEYHPEQAGTPYEVQLGLLGDELLTKRGWLPVAAAPAVNSTQTTAGPSAGSHEFQQGTTGMAARATTYQSGADGSTTGSRSATPTGQPAASQPTAVGSTTNSPAYPAPGLGATVIVVPQIVNVRAAASLTGTILGVAHQGDRLVVDGPSDHGWIHVRNSSGGASGWVFGGLTRRA